MEVGKQINDITFIVVAPFSLSAKWQERWFWLAMILPSCI